MELETINVDAVVVGAGIIGMAIARELALKGLQVAVIERGERAGTEITSRNSGVIHAGLYYEPGSLRAQFCVAGNAALHAYAQNRGIRDYIKSGKLVVATSLDEVEALHQLKIRAETNGVRDMTLLSGEQARVLEPNLTSTIEALHVPSSGLISVHHLMEALELDTQDTGNALFQYNMNMVKAEITKTGFDVLIEGAAKNTHGVSYQISCKYLINAAGLGAQSVAASITGFDPAKILRQKLVKGNYFVYTDHAAPFGQPIYPMPGKLSGLHFRTDFDGRSIFGPDSEPIDTVNYRVDEKRGDYFFGEIQKYFPAIRRDKLVPDYAGVRPLLADYSDFVIQTKQDHGITGLVNLFGIGSPGLTSALPLAQSVFHHLFA